MCVMSARKNFVGLPCVYMLLTEYPELELNKSTSRFKNLFNLDGYLSDLKGYANWSDLFTGTLHYGSNQYALSWAFLGGSTILLTLLSLFYDRKKAIICLLTSMFLILLSAPSDAGLVSLGHYINFFTNPLSFLN